MRYVLVLVLVAGLLAALAAMRGTLIVDCAGWEPGVRLGEVKFPVSCDRDIAPIQAECVKRGGFLKEGLECLPKNAEVQKCVARDRTWFESSQTCQLGGQSEADTLHTLEVICLANGNTWNASSHTCAHTQTQPPRCLGAAGTAASHAKRGSELHHAGKHEAAIHQFNISICLDPKNAEFYFLRGATRLLLGLDQSAESDFSEAVRLDPTLEALINK